MEIEGSQALSQQAELIYRQLQELRRLEEEVRVLRETSLQQKMKLEAQAMELEALARAEKAGRAEAEGLRAALAGAEVVRKNLEEGSQRELEEIKRLHQEQVNMGVRRVQFLLEELARSFLAKSKFHRKVPMTSGVIRCLGKVKDEFGCFGLCSVGSTLCSCFTQDTHFMWEHCRGGEEGGRRLLRWTGERRGLIQQAFLSATFCHLRSVWGLWGGQISLSPCGWS